MKIKKKKKKKLWSYHGIAETEQKAMELEISADQYQKRIVFWKNV